MAERRMFTVKVTEGDAFYSLSPAAQALYLHLAMVADEDGFINNAVGIAGRITGGRAALKLLVERRFLLRFENIFVVKHWRMANSLKNDRLKPCAYPEVAKRIWVKSNKSYTDHPVEGCMTLYEKKTGVPAESDRIPIGFQLDSVWIPSRTEPNRTEPNRAEPNREEGDGGGFAGLWEVYPELRRGVKSQAEAAYKDAIQTEADAVACMRHLTRWKRSEQWIKEAGRYVPYLVNWLGRGLWNVSPSETKPAREPDEDERRAIQRMMEEDLP